jgi:hypothetical protein
MIQIKVNVERNVVNLVLTVLTFIVCEIDTRQHFLFEIQILSIHSCKATIQDYKSVEYEILEFFPDFRDFFPKKWHDFLSKISIK